MGVTLTYSKSDESNPARTVNAFEYSERTKEARPEQSFSSLSSVTVNHDDTPSSTDIELAQMNGIQGSGGNAKHVRSGSFNDNVVNRKYSKVAAIYFTNGSNPSKSKYSLLNSGREKNVMKCITDTKKGLLTETNGLNVKKRPELKCSSVLIVDLASTLQISKKSTHPNLSLIHICRCRRYAVCRSRWSPYH
eukprot:TRINITY_DN16424_c0_g1_i2.p2 TRINITY_DN16424_c0_g1~~TRINITY_DN16424_c0_g1_i2.p2  ORF type:complete len:192 (-),score=48.00 TRINITY_DN16424_c0_g1_i2:8-583(-)